MWSSVVSNEAQESTRILSSQFPFHIFFLLESLAAAAAFEIENERASDAVCDDANKNHRTPHTATVEFQAAATTDRVSKESETKREN